MQNFDQTPFDQFQPRVGNTNVKYVNTKLQFLNIFVLVWSHEEENRKLEDKKKHFTAAAPLKGGEYNGPAAALQRPVAARQTCSARPAAARPPPPLSSAAIRPQYLIFDIWSCDFGSWDHSKPNHRTRWLGDIYPCDIYPCDIYPWRHLPMGDIYPWHLPDMMLDLPDIW